MFRCRGCGVLLANGWGTTNDCPTCRLDLDYIGDGTMDFNNGTDFEFADISSELWREYRFAKGIIRIDAPLRLHVSNSGGHRVFDADGYSHYIPPTWLHLRWQARDGEPHFVK